MNPNLHNLAKLVGTVPDTPVKAYGDIKMRLSATGQVLVEMNRFLDHVFADLAPEHLDRRALKKHLADPAAPDRARRIGGVRYRHYGALKAALQEALGDGTPAKDAFTKYPWAEFEPALFSAARAILEGAAGRWSARADQLEARVAKLRAGKRTFDEAFAATPAAGPLDARPAKAARFADSASGSASDSDSASDDDDSEFSGSALIDDLDDDSVSSELVFSEDVLSDSDESSASAEA